jgi:uncharacterized protein
VSTPVAHLDDLQFNVAGLLKGPVGGARVFELRAPVSEVDRLDESFDAIGPFEGVARLLRTTDTILTRLKGATRVRLECGRCLESFEAEIAIEAEEEFRPSLDIITGRPVKDTGDDAALVIDDHHILDLSELVRQAILLALPLTPLCREDCAGLCPVCGANRNQEPCDCEADVIDARWSSLGALLELETLAERP